MSDPQKCPKCGVELLADAPAGLCPKCLVAAGFESEAGSHADQPKSDPEAPTIDSPSPGTGFLPPLPSELADRFAQLEILELLGHGGMGAVYKARQTNLDRLVALKIIRPEATHDPAFAERFNREAKTLARLSHQHIVAVHDFGEVEYAETDDQPSRPLFYFLMEYVDGANLRQLMRAGELTPEQALAIVPQICDALQYAHDEGVVHRDIKPENILLDKRGRVKIADFGLAKLATGSAADYRLTGTHQVMGTLRYMAPEQLEGSHAVDHRADIYSLGVVFYEMLTGEAPMGHFEPPSKKVQVDVRLDEVVLRSLAREPERRYQHVRDVKTDVESICSSALPRSQPTDPSSSARLGIADETQFSGKAIVGGILAVVFLVFMAPVYAIARSSGLPVSLGLFLFIICVVSGPVSCLFGMVAINDIRYSKGRIRGLGLAFLDAAFFPLVVLDGLIAALGLWINAHIRGPDDVSPWTAILIGLAILLVDALILVPTWRATARWINPSTGSGKSASIECGPAPAAIWWTNAAMFVTAWVLTAAMWNFGKWGLYAAGAVFVALVTAAIRRRLRYAPFLRDDGANDGQSASGFGWASGVLAFILGYVLLINAQITSWDLCGFSERIEDIGQRLAASPHRLIRELDAFRDDIPTVEFVKHGGIRHVSYSNVGELLWYWVLGTAVVFMSVLTLVQTRKYRWTWQGHWKPSLSMTSSLLAPLLLLTAFTHFTGGSLHGRHELRGNVDAGQLVAAMAEWAEQHSYHIRSDGQWLLQTIPDGNTVGSLHLAQLEIASIFDRWKTSLGGVVEQGPAYEIQLVTSSEPAETIVRIDTRQAMIGPRTRWSDDYPGRGLEKSFLASLKSAVGGEPGAPAPVE